MAKDNIVSGIDIGTSKITTLIGTVSDDHPDIQIIGVSTVPSRGLRKGQVVNIEDATAAISQSLEAAERMAGASVTKAYVSIGGSHIASINSHGVVAVAEPEREISQADIRRVIEAAKAVQLPQSRDILHVLPRGYVVDGQEGIVDPVGMTGVRLEVDTHLVTGGSTAVRNLYKCVEELGVEVGGVVFGGYSAAVSSITETEKELGVVLVDIGGGTTDVAIFVDGALSYSIVLPIGAINITKDLAAGLRISLESAEKIKLHLGEVPKSVANVEVLSPEHGKAKENTDDIDLRGLNLPEEMRSVSRKTLVEGIIKPRLNEIFTMVGLEIKRSGFGGLTPSGVVVTGGGALTVGCTESAKRNLAMPVHIGTPLHVKGLVDEILTPSYSASCGLLLYAAQQKKSDVHEGGFSFGKSGSKLQVKGVAGKLMDLVKSLLP